MHASIIGRQFCVKCNEQRDHVRFGRRIEPSKTPDTTFIWAEFWAATIAATIWRNGRNARGPRGCLPAATSGVTVGF